jgi:outer membrane lipoprotein-sorting protein
VTVDVYDASAHREEFETFLVLGFGSSGDEMRKTFDITYGGEEKIDGTDTVRLELVPKSDKIKEHFPKIILWINPQTGISVQQKLMETDGDYRLAKYSDIQLGQKIPAKVFQLKTSGKTKIVTH